MILHGSLATSEMGQLQTVFYIVLVGGIIIGFVLFLLGVGAATLPSFFRRAEHRLLASLVGGALVFTFAFVAATSAVLIYSVSHHG